MNKSLTALTVVMFVACGWARMAQGDGFTIGVMKVNGIPCVTEQMVKDDLQSMKERLMQANVNISMPGLPFIHYFDAPEWFATNATWYITTNATAPYCLTPQVKSILDATGAYLTITTWLIYVPQNMHPTLQNVEGATIVKALFQQNEDAEYLDNCFISATRNSPYTFVHEFLHTLGLGHVLMRWNLMYQEPSTNKNATGTKRLTSEQIEKIREKMD